MVKGTTITSFFAPRGRKGQPQDSENKKRPIDLSEKQPEKKAHDDNETNSTEKKQKLDLQILCNNNGSAKLNEKKLTEEVNELLSNIYSECWRNALNKHITSQQFAKLAKFVSLERQNKIIYPPVEDTFTSLNLVPISQVRVVIVGQDPYHGPSQGHGLAFSVRRNIAVPPSLKNIYKELKSDKQLSYIPTHGDLHNWAAQGVLLLNSVLTVQKAQPNSHAKKGWEEFTDFVISTLDSYHSKGLIFLLWGRPASAKAQRLLMKNKSKHTVICTSHPSPLGATKTSSPFLGSRCFSRTNDVLKERGLDAIDWNVD